MTQRVLVGTAVAVALFLDWLTWDGWLTSSAAIHLVSRWRAIPVPFSTSTFRRGEQPFTFYFGSPRWPRLSLTSSVVAGHRPLLGWPSRPHLLVGAYDVVQYGTMGSPTSIWTVLLLFLFAF